MTEYLKMKGQSAIEYLTTYGWMMLAVAVVGGVAYSNIQASCSTSSSDFYTDSIDINNFGLDGRKNLILSIKNDGYTEIKLNQASLSINDRNKTKKLDKNLSAGNYRKLKLQGFRSTKVCNQLDIKLEFEKGSLKNQEATGYIRAPIGFN